MLFPVLTVLLLKRHELLCKEMDLLFIFPEKVVLHQAQLPVYAAGVDYLAVQFLRHQHIVELAVLIFCRKDIDLVNTVGKPDF